VEIPLNEPQSLIDVSISLGKFQNKSLYLGMAKYLTKIQMFQPRRDHANGNSSLRHLNENGFSLSEMMIVAGIMGVLLLAMMTMQSNQTKANNFLQFQLRRTELQGAIVGQFLKDANNCACLFKGANPFLASTAAVAPRGHIDRRYADTHRIISKPSAWVRRSDSSAG
jgi:prepilin-type N-terminal cleavage/methylation domain-containing protein